MTYKSINFEHFRENVILPKMYWIIELLFFKHLKLKVLGCLIIYGGQHNLKTNVEKQKRDIKITFLCNLLNYSVIWLYLGYCRLTLNMTCFGDWHLFPGEKLRNIALSLPPPSLTEFSLTWWFFWKFWQNIGLELPPHGNPGSVCVFFNPVENTCSSIVNAKTVNK